MRIGKIGNNGIGTGLEKTISLPDIHAVSTDFVGGRADRVTADSFDVFDLHETVSESEELAA